MTYLLILAAGSVIGFTMGSLGGGGGVMVVPVLVYGLGYPPALSSAVAKLVVGASSLTGIVMRWRDRSVAPRAAALVAASSLPAAAVGGWLSTELPAAAMRLLLAVVVIGGAGAMLLQGGAPRRPKATSEPLPGPGEAAKGQFERVGGRWAWVLAAGALVGFLGGSLGVGGGFLLVPALHLTGLTMKQSISTALVNITLNCAIGLVTGWNNDLPWSEVLLFMTVAFAASIVGARFARRLAGPQLRKGFAIFLLVLGVLILGETLVTGDER